MSHSSRVPGATERRHVSTVRARDAERKLKIVNEIIAATHKETTILGLLEGVMDAALRLLKYDFGGCYLVQPQNRTAEIVFEHGLPADFFDLVRRVEIDREPYRTVLVEGRPIVVDHYERTTPPREHCFGIRAFASVPLLIGDEVLGALNFGSTRRFRISKDDAAVLASIGREVGDAIGRLRDREQLRRQQEDLHATDISRQKQAEDEVNKAYAELENRIRERTAELAAANSALEEEIAWRKSVESALRKSEQHSRILFNTINEGFALCQIVCDDAGGLPDYRFLKVNPAFERMMGFAAEQAEGSTIRELIPDIDPLWVEPLIRVALTGEPVHYEYLYDRVGRWFEVSASCPAPGTFTHLLVDITGRKRWEEALQESEDRYRSLVELSPDAILIHQDDRFVYVNPAGARLLGASDAQQIIGQRVMDIISPKFRSLVRRNIRSDLLGEESPLTELEALRLDGTRITIEGRGTRTYYKGRPAVQAIFRNVTERKRAERAVLTRNRQLSILNRFIGAVSLSLSLDELLKTALEKTIDLLDLDAGLVIMQGPDREEAIPVCHKGLPGILPDHLVSAAQRLVETDGRSRFIGQDSESPDEKVLLNALALSSLACIPLIVESEVVGALFVGSRGKGVIKPEERALLKAIGHEIESRLLRGMLYQRLEEAHAEANLYLDIMTHDIRNAENVSGLYTELLINAVKGEGADYARKLRASIRRSIDILGNVSTIRKIHHQSADLLPICLDAVIRESITGFPDADIRYAGSSIQVLADSLLSEIFSNLIGNAVKFGGSCVEITIRVDERDGDVLVSVEDTGPGIPDVVKHAIFKRFERGKRSGKGEGLGLYITKTLVERYGGRVWAEDRVCGHPEEGVAFRFSLPAVKPCSPEGPNNGC